MNKPIADIPHPKMLLDPYAAWAANEGVPVIEDFGVDLLKVPTAPWRRFGIDGALVHLKGRGDFVSIFVLELAPGAKSAPQKHLFEEVVYVLSGHGNTTIETSDGRKHSFEWGPKSLFALPLNSRYQHFNSSGRERARLASTNNLALMLNLFHNDAFVFDNGHEFPERQGAAKYFSDEGEQEFVRIDWKHGWVFAPPDQMFHQHFNTAPDPARYLAVAFGSLRYPFTTDKRRLFLGMDVSVKDGGCQIEYEHQDSRIHE